MIPDINLKDGIHIPADTVKGLLWGGVESGIRWLEHLPAILDQLCQKHEITDLRPSPEIRMNLVLFGESATHGPVVLKLAQPHWEATNEITALRILGKTGHYAPLIDADVAGAWSLQERIQPGEMLQTFAQSGEVSDEKATQITAGLMRATASPVPSDTPHLFPDLNRWLRSLWEYAASGRDEIPPDQVELAIRYARDLIAHPAPAMLLHGDFHHGNILKGEVDWVIIDPKGIQAELAFEVGPFFYNPIGVDKRPNLVEVFDRRLSIFSQELGIDRIRLWRCALIACVLSDCWSLEEGPVNHVHFNTVTAALMQLPDRNA